MADLSNKSVLGLAVETVPGTFVAPNTTTDLIRIADLRLTINGLTVTTQEFTGSIHRPGPSVLGKTFEISGRIILRGPGGTSPPAADGFVPGRILRAGGFEETVISTAVPASPAEVGVGSTTTTAVLGTAAAATADVYKGLALFLESIGASVPRGLAMIRAYSAGKAALLARVAGATIADDYQIPKQLAYRLSATATPPSLSASCWFGGRRYDGNGLAISSLRINIPTASREANEFPSIEFTLAGDYQQDADEAAPIPPSVLAVPPYRDGHLWVANKQIGGASISIDLGAEIGYPPNPNRASGNDAAQLTATTRTVTLNLNQQLKATLDFVALADAQATHAIEAMWGLASGNYFGVIVTDARFNYQSPDNSGAFITTQGEAYVDDADRTIALTIPFWGA